MEREMSEESEQTIPEVVRIERWHIADPRILQDIVEDMQHFLYLTNDWSPEFYVKQAYEGFVAVAYEDTFLLPEMQTAYAVVDLSARAVSPPLHMSKSLRRHLRRHPSKLTLTFNTALEEVLSGIETHHSGRNWLQTQYGKLAKLLMTLGNIVISDSNFRFLSVELWEESKLVAGEVGYAIGNVYTSLTGFRAASSDSRLAVGTVQLLTLGHLLKQS